jgi:hypothetical protein
MDTQTQPKKIDLLTLSDAEKASFILEIRKYLRQKLEEAKFWRTLAENDRILIKGFEESKLPQIAQSITGKSFS